MTEIQFQLRRYGLWLYLLGLLLGFVLPAFARRPIALGVHVAALLGGTFLMALASFWPRPGVSSRAVGITAHALALGLFGLDLGLTLTAALEDPARHPGLRLIALVLTVGSSLVILIAVAYILIGFKRDRAAA